MEPTWWFDNKRSEDRSPGAASVERRSGQFVDLVPIGREDLGFLYDLAVSEETGWNWRFSGTVPRPEDFERDLWAGVHAQFVVVERKSKLKIGHVMAYGADPRRGYCYIAGAIVPNYHLHPAAIEALWRFTIYLFMTWPFRKLYFEMPEYNLPSIRGGLGQYFMEEGCLKDHVYVNGHFWDWYFLAIYRDQFLNLPELRRRIDLPPDC